MTQIPKSSTKQQLYAITMRTARVSLANSSQNNHIGFNLMRVISNQGEGIAKVQIIATLTEKKMNNNGLRMTLFK